MKLRLRGWHIALGFFVCALIQYRAFLMPGELGFVFDWGYPVTEGITGARDLLRSIVYLWSSDGGGATELYRTAVPVQILQAFYMVLGGSATGFFKLLIVSGSATVGATVYASVRRFLPGLGVAAAVVGALFVQVHPFWYQRVEIGYIGYLVSVPAALTVAICLHAWARQRSVRPLLLAALAGLFVGYQLQVMLLSIYVAVLAVVGMLIIPHLRRYILPSCIGVAAVGIAWLGFHAYWLIPALENTAQQISQLSNQYRTANLPATWWLAVLGLDQPNYHELYAAALRNKVFLVLLASPLVVAWVLGLLQRQYRFLVCLLSVIAAGAATFTMGYNEPVGFKLGSMLRSVLPGSAFFREPHHMQVVVVLGLGLLMAIGVAGVVQRLRHWPRVASLSVGLVCAAALSLWALPTQLPALQLAGSPVQLPQSVRDMRESIGTSKAGMYTYMAPGLGFWKIANDARSGAAYADQGAKSAGVLTLNQASTELDAQSAQTALRNATAYAYVSGDAALVPLLQQQSVERVILRHDMISKYYQSVALDGGAYGAAASVWVRALQQDDSFVQQRGLGVVRRVGEVTIADVPEALPKVRSVSRLQQLCSLDQVSSRSGLGFVVGPISSALRDVTAPCEDAQLRGWLEAPVSSQAQLKSQLQFIPAQGWSDGQRAPYTHSLVAYSPAVTFVTARSAQISFIAQGENVRLPYYVQGDGAELSIASNGTVFFTITPQEEQVGWRYLDIPTATGASIEITAKIPGEGLGVIGRPFTPSESRLVAQAPQEMQRLALESISETPTRRIYRVTSPTSGPSMVVLAESFHRGWELQAGTARYQSMAVNGTMNGFLVQGGISQGSVVIISYAPQQQFVFLQALSFMLVTLLCLASVAITRKRR
jgi:hypothetical protein